MSRFGDRPENGGFPRRILRQRLARPLLIAVGLVAVACVLLSSAALSSKATAQQRVHAGKDGVRITGEDQEIRAGGDCAYVRNGRQVIEAGNCKDTTGGGPKTHPENTALQKKAHHEQTTTGQSTMLEGTSPQTTGPTSMDTTLPGGTTSPELTSPNETTLPETTLPQELTTTLPGETTSLGGASCPGSPPKDSVAATVTRAVDGDTVKLEKPVKGEDTVRFIGVNTPELEGKNGKPQAGAREAKSFTAKSLEGKRVLLEIGKDPTDDYGRLLAYVWTEQSNKPASEGLVKKIGNFISGKDSKGDTRPQLFEKTLLERGYARVMTVEPNDEYADCLKEIAPPKTTPDGPPSDAQYGDTTSDAAPPSGGQYRTNNGAVPPSTKPETTAAETTMPEQTAPEQSTPRKSTPEKSAPEQSTSEQTTPEQTVPEQTKPRDEATDRAASKQYVDRSATLTKSTPERNSAGKDTTPQAPDAPTSPSVYPAGQTTTASQPPEITMQEQPPARASAPPALPGPTLTSTNDQPPATAPSPVPTLAQQKAASSSVAVLPDTGGPKLAQRSAPTLMLGVGLLILGASGFLLAGQLRPGERANGRDRREP